MWNSMVAMIFENFDCIWKLCNEVQGESKLEMGLEGTCLIEQVAYPQDPKTWKSSN